MCALYNFAHLKLCPFVSAQLIPDTFPYIHVTERSGPSSFESNYSHYQQQAWRNLQSTQLTTDFLHVGHTLHVPNHSNAERNLATIHP